MADQEKAIAQLEEIRDSGETNMMDGQRVMEIAVQDGHHALVNYARETGVIDTSRSRVRVKGPEYLSLLAHLM